MRILAQVFNYLFHPIYLLFVSIIIVVSIDPYLALRLPEEIRYRMYGVLLINTVLLPIGSLLLLKRTGHISSIHLSDRKERIGPFFLILFYYGTTYYMFRSNFFPVEILSILLASISTLLIAFIISPYWKISAHGMGIGGLAGALYGIATFGGDFNFHFITIAVLLGGAVCWARLKTNAHTFGQVAAGWLVGFLFEWLYVANEFYI